MIKRASETNSKSVAEMKGVEEDSFFLKRLRGILSGGQYDDVSRNGPQVK